MKITIYIESDEVIEAKLAHSSRPSAEPPPELLAPSVEPPPELLQAARRLGAQSAGRSTFSMPAGVTALSSASEAPRVVALTDSDAGPAP